MRLFLNLDQLGALADFRKDSGAGIPYLYENVTPNNLMLVLSVEQLELRVERLRAPHGRSRRYLCSSLVFLFFFCTHAFPTISVVTRDHAIKHKKYVSVYKLHLALLTINSHPPYSPCYGRLPTRKKQGETFAERWRSDSLYQVVYKCEYQ